MFEVGNSYNISVKIGIIKEEHFREFIQHIRKYNFYSENA